MRKLAGMLFTVVSIYAATLAQDHIPVPHTIPHGNSRICWGYAMGRVAGRYEGDASCDPATLIPDANGIDFVYFDQTSWSFVDQLQGGDILYWPGTHAAYVTSVPRDGQGHVIVDNIGVAHMSAYQWEGVIYESLSAAKSRVGVGNPSSFCRRKQISITVSNSFGGGNVKVSGGTYASGSFVPVNWWSSVSLEAIDQDYQNVWRKWANWQIPDLQNPVAQNPISVTAKANGSYTANFMNWSDISFSNSFPGASGGTMSVWDTVRNAPGTVRMPQNTPFNIAASTFVVMDRVEYTFSQWNDGNTSSSRNLTAPQHATYTANFNPKPQPPANVHAGGNEGENIVVTWDAHPSSYVTEYQIWRMVKPYNQNQRPPELLTTVSKPTTSYTDPVYVITYGSQADLVQYDVRAHFSFNSISTYSDPNYVTAWGRVGIESIRGNDANGMMFSEPLLPDQYAISNFPNPFNPSTTLSYQLAEDVNVQLKIYDVMGREVVTLLDAQKQAGYHSVQWSGKDTRGTQVSSGVYLYRFTAIPASGGKPFITSGKLLLTK